MVVDTPSSPISWRLFRMCQRIISLKLDCLTILREPDKWARPTRKAGKIRYSGVTGGHTRDSRSRNAGQVEGVEDVLGVIQELGCRIKDESKRHIIVMLFEEVTPEFGESNYEWI